MTYYDKISHKRVEFRDEQLFAVYTKVRNGRRLLMKLYRAHDAEKAFNDFYSLDIPDSHRKYIQLHCPTKMLPNEGEIILSMRGYSPNANALRLKTGRKLLAYRKVATLNLINTPEAIAIKLRALDFLDFPMVPEKWTQTKLMYCLLSYFFTLDKDSRDEMLKKAFLAYVSDKLASGGRFDEAGEVLEKIPDNDVL